MNQSEHETRITDAQELRAVKIFLDVLILNTDRPLDPQRIMELWERHYRTLEIDGHDR